MPDTLASLVSRVESVAPESERTAIKGSWGTSPLLPRFLPRGTPPTPRGRPPLSCRCGQYGKESRKPRQPNGSSGRGSQWMLVHATADLLPGLTPVRRASGIIAAMLLSVALAAACSPTTPAAVPSTPMTPRPTEPRTPLTMPPITDFLLQSVSFISPTTGWVLGESPCSAGRCFSMFDTSDGGTSWNVVTAPPFSVSPSSYSFDSASIAFADADDGWAYDTSETQAGGGTGDQLFSTHDGGRRWEPVSLPNDDQSRIQDMADGNGQIWLITFDGVGDDFVIYGSPIEYDNWDRSLFSLPLSAGPVTNFSITLQGEHGWIVENDRGVITGASLDDGAWTAWTPPCNRAVGSYDDESLAAISPTYVVALCPPNLAAYASKPPPVALFASDNAGTSFQMVATKVPSAAVGLAASPSGALFCFDGQGILASFDAGVTWQMVLGFGNATFPYGRLLSPYTGITFVASAIGYASTPSGDLFKTVDGGHNWEPVSLSAM